MKTKRILVSTTALLLISCSLLLVRQTAAQDCWWGPGCWISVQFPGSVCTPENCWCGPTIFPKEGATGHFSVGVNLLSVQAPSWVVITCPGLPSPPSPSSEGQITVLPNTGPARFGTLVFQGYDSSGAPRLCSKTIQQEAGSPPPVLRVNPTTLSFGYSPPRQTLNIWNNGGGILGYSVSANRSWIGVYPGSGTCGAGQTNFITVSIDVSALLVGTHTGTVTVASTAGTTNIAVTVHIADNDGDLIPDGWETQYFGSPANCNPFLDSDGDGQNNRQEWIGGSNPTNKLSAFTISSVALGPGGSNVVIRWPTLPGRVYDVLWSTDASGPFLPLTSNLPHTQTNYITTPALPVVFFRIDVRKE